jgi:rhodanese-related sulfurtransferase
MTYAGDLTPSEAFDLLRTTDAVLLDVRTPQEWQDIGVPDLDRVLFVPWVVELGGLVNEDFVDQARTAGCAGRTVLVICRAGQRSVAAATALTAAGLGPVLNVLDGVEGPPGPDGRRDSRGWLAEGLPVRPA